jgi:hypothetical protein
VCSVSQPMAEMLLLWSRFFLFWSATRVVQIMKGLGSTCVRIPGVLDGYPLVQPNDRLESRSARMPASKMPSRYGRFLQSKSTCMNSAEVAIMP